jgi:hypothetical protein
MWSREGEQGVVRQVVVNAYVDCDVYFRWGNFCREFGMD